MSCVSEIASNIGNIKRQIPSSVKLIAVSKTRPFGDILEAYNAGQKSFGENRVQEILSKKDFVPADIEWHLIGHLQSNKVKYVVPFISMIQSVDSFKLLGIINDEASKADRIINCLLQIHIAEEETKYGFSMNELTDSLENSDIMGFKNVLICGVMGMATFTDDNKQIRKEFRYLKQCYEVLKSRYFSSYDRFREISMGMSGDYQIAVEEGSTMIRVGSLIFGERTKLKSQ